MLTQERMAELYDTGRNFIKSRGFFDSVTGERRIERLRTDGLIPDDISGAYYLAGPGNFRSPNGKEYAHIFDGDGMIAAFSLRGGAIGFANRFVHTREYDAEQRAGHQVFGSFGMKPPRGPFGIPRPLSFKNSVNHGIAFVNGRLLALNDGALPIEIDPTTLETVGSYNFQGSLSRLGVLAAHPHWMEAPYEAYVLSMNPVGVHPSVTIHRSTGGRARPLATIQVEHLTFVHDFAITQRHIVISIGSLGLSRRRLLAWMMGTGTLAATFKWLDDTPNEIIVLRRSDGSIVRRYETEPSFLFHMANAYDDEDGSVVLDAACYEHSAIVTAHLQKFLHESSTDEEFRRAMPELMRFRIHANGTITRTSFADIAMEFACYPDDIYATKHRYLYPLDVGCYSRLLKLDTETGDVKEVNYGANCFGSEGVFVRKKDSRAEDDGWLLNCVYDASDHHSFLSIVDARTMSELGRAHLPFHVPIRFHATFLSGVALR